MLILKQASLLSLKHLLCFVVSRYNGCDKSYGLHRPFCSHSTTKARTYATLRLQFMHLALWLLFRNQDGRCTCRRGRNAQGRQPAADLHVSSFRDLTVSESILLVCLYIFLRVLVFMSLERNGLRPFVNLSSFMQSSSIAMRSINHQCPTFFQYYRYQAIVA